MAEKYGLPGATDSEGFDPYADSVGPGIYGGRVKRSSDGNVVVGQQYQNHNARPGPVYAGGGYAPICNALDSSANETLRDLLEKYPDLANSVTTGGAQPLHMCGMGRRKQQAAALLIEHGADIEAIDTYGMTPLHRCASNNLDEAAKILLAGGADAQNQGLIGTTPLVMAQQSRARNVIAVLEEHLKRTPGRSANRLTGVRVLNAGFEEVNGEYSIREASEVPEAFAKVCQQNDWDSGTMWKKLNNGRTWFLHERVEDGNLSYIYYNSNDGKWWLDGPDGLGLYTAQASSHNPPGNSAWELLDKDKAARNGASTTLPTLLMRRTSPNA